MKKFAIYLLIAALMLALAGCESEDVVLEDLLPRENVQEASVSYLNAGVGENIPQVRYASDAEEFGQLCDLLYGAVPVVVEIPTSYSPEINASHEIFLTTAGGTMSLYYDDYQNLINIPINRKVDGESVRVYLSFQAQGLSELLTQWGETVTAQTGAASGQTVSGTFPPDDSQLRASIDATLFDQVATPVAYEAASYQNQGSGAVYYAFGTEDLSTVAQDKILLVATPAAGDARQATIASVSESDYYILVQVDFAPLAEGQTAVPSAVLCARADVDKSKPIVFIDAEHNILYAQMLALVSDDQTQPVTSSAPEASAQPETGEQTGGQTSATTSGTATATATPKPTTPATTPSTASGGEVGSDEPLQP